MNPICTPDRCTLLFLTCMRCGGLCGVQGGSPLWRQLRWGERAGRTHPDTCPFDGTESALPYSAMTFG